MEPSQSGTIADGTFWLPRQLSTLAPEIDFGWDVAYWISVFFFILVIVPLAYFVWRYRRRSEDEQPEETGHNTALEITWSVIPLAIVMACFLVGFRGFMAASVVPGNAYEIKVAGAKWFWTFTYPNGVVVPGELRVPKGQPVKMLMSSRDVIHSFFVPEFRVKQDVVPGLYTTVWFEATETGETVMLCAEYCGKDHSNMLAKVIVMEPSEFETWLNSQAKPEEASSDYGQKLFTQYGCNACHSVDGARGIGPSIKGLYGRDESLADGSTVKADENYLKESILNPAAKIVAGYAPTMPAFQGQLDDVQVDSLIEYIKTLK